MKKILILTYLLIISAATFAQVNLFKGDLSQAKIEAKNQGKKLIVITTSTSDQFYKKMESEIFSQVEVGEFINKDYILLPLFLDNDMTLRTELEIMVAPTTILYDAQGNEISRHIGSHGERFISDITKMFTDNENRFDYHESKLQQEPSYAVEYSKLLDSKFFMKRKSDNVLLSYLKTLPPDEAISEYMIEIYEKNIRYINSPIYSYLLDNSESLLKKDGKGRYTYYMIDVTKNMVKHTIFERNYSQANFDKCKNIMETHPFLRSTLSVFLIENKDRILKRDDLNSIITSATRYIKSADYTKNEMIKTTLDIIRPEKDKTAYNKNLIKLFDTALKNESDKKKKAGYKEIINRIKNIVVQ